MATATEAIRAVIQCEWRRGTAAKEIESRLREQHGESAPSYRTILRWIHRFEEGKEGLQDEPRSGRPSTATNARTIVQIEKLLMEDRRVTVAEVAEACGISFGSAHTVLTQHLGMSKVCARWVPKLLTPDMQRTRVRNCQQLLALAEQNQDEFLDSIVTGDESWFSLYEPETKAQSMQWKRPDEAVPLKAKTVPSMKKRMGTIFWDRRGVLLVEWLPEKHTVTGSSYVATLHNLRQAIKEKRRGKMTRGIRLLHDNASAHTCHKAQDEIRKLGWTQLPHPAYSPDLAPSDFWLLPALKNSLRGRHWSSAAALASSVHQWCEHQDESWYAAGIQKLLERWAKCVAVRGNFVEKVEVE